MKPLAFATLGLEKFEDFCSAISKTKDDITFISGTYARFLWRSPNWENCPVKIYSAAAELVFSGIYYYSVASNGNICRELISDQGESMGDQELDSLAFRLLQIF